jgi:phosphoglycerate dehydrogenase-like enzyme
MPTAQANLKPAPQGRPARIAILDDYMDVALRLADWSRVRAKAEITVFNRHLGSVEEAIAALAPFDIICSMRERMDMPRALIEGLPNLCAITITGQKNRTLDMAAAAERSIAIMCTVSSGTGQFATAELSWGLILSLMRHIPEQSAGMRQGRWQTRMGSSIYGKTLGLIGLGKLGARMAMAANAFGMKVLAWSQNLDEARAVEAGAIRVDKATLLREADVVSLHLVLSERTRGIIGAGDLALMKPSAILINTSRGPLIDEAALIEALGSGRIAGAGIDVFDHEPLPEDHPLRKLPHALLTPHLGYTVHETFERFYAETVENLEAYLAGSPIRLVSA